MLSKCFSLITNDVHLTKFIYDFFAKVPMVLYLKGQKLLVLGIG